MKVMMLTLLVSAALAIAGIFVLDRLIPWILRRLAPILPSDVVGPEGWLLDTRDAKGVFDHSRSV